MYDSILCPPCCNVWRPSWLDQNICLWCWMMQSFLAGSMSNMLDGAILLVGFEHHCSHLHDIITFMALFAFLLLSLVELPVRVTFDVSCHFK